MRDYIVDMIIGFVVVVITVCVTIFLSIVVIQHHKTEDMYITNGYTRATLQGEDYSHWVKPIKEATHEGD